MIRNGLGCGVLVAVSLAGCAVDASGDTDLEAAGEPAGEIAQELKRNALSRQQEAQALQLIDDICGDTWCEGDHNFRFDRLECQKSCGHAAGSCKLTFRIFSYDTDIDTGPTYVRSCETRGFTGYPSLVQTQGSYASLAPDYYSALTECISRVERQLPR